jgi:tetratricopeptide (TPR) repeat protein
MKTNVLIVLAILTAGVIGGPSCGVALGGVPRGGSEAATGEGNAQAFADYTVGVFLLEGGSAPAAIPYLESAWENSSHDETIGAKLAEAYFSVRDLSRCETIADELLSRDQSQTGALLLKAKIAYSRSHKEEALTYLERIESAEEPSFDIQRILAAVYTELGMNDKAMAAYKRALTIDPTHSLVQYGYGALLRDAGRLDEAEQAFRRAVDLKPGFADAALGLAAIVRDRGNYAEAESVLVVALDADPSNYDVVDALTKMYIDKEELEKAIRVLESEKRQSALPNEGLLLLGRLYYEVKDYDEALGIFEVMFDSGDATADLARVLGEISSKAGKKDKAAKYYRDAVRLAPEDYRNYLALFIGSSATFTPEDSERVDLSPAEALRALTDAARLAPASDVEALYLIGVSYQSIDSLQAAREYLGRAAEIRPEDAHIVLSLANVLEKMKRYEDAERYLAVLHEKQPDDATTCNFYGYLLSLMGKELDKAEQLVRKALESEPDNGFYIDSLGWVFFMRGEYGRAVEELEKATKIVKDDPVILEHLGDAYKAAKRYRDAVTAYERSKSLRKDGGTNDLVRKIDEARSQAGD